MLYLVAYHLDGITNHGGAICTSRSEAVAFAKSMAETALAQGVSIDEWYDLEGEEVDPHKALSSDNEDLIVDMIGQVSDALKGSGPDYIDICEYDDLLALIEAQHVIEWCSPATKARIQDFRRAYEELIVDLDREWDET